MAKYDKDFKRTGAAAKQADLPKDFEIAGALRSGSRVFLAGDEEAYAETKPLASDVERHVENGVIRLPKGKK